MLTIAFLDIYSFLPSFLHIYTFLRMNKTWKNKKKIRKTRKPRTDGFLVFRLEGGVFIVVLQVSDRQARRLSPSLLWAHLCVSMPQ